MISIGLVVSIVFGILAAFNPKPITIFNWYHLVNVVMNIIIIARLTTYFLHNKIFDQTITIIIQQKTKRINVLFSMWFSIFISLILYEMACSLITILFNFDNRYLLRFDTVNLIYKFLTTIVMVTFLFFATLVFKPQIVSIILSFVLVSLFVSSLPQQFFDNKMQSVQITLNPKNGKQVQYQAQEINDAFIFNENITKRQIKYPDLSQYINDYYVNQDYTIENFKEIGSINSRFELWNNLNIINEKPTDLNVDGNRNFELEIRSIEGGSGLKDFEIGDIVNVNLNFKNYFKTLDEIKRVEALEANQSKQRVLKDLIQYIEDYTQTFAKSQKGVVQENLLKQKMWEDKYADFGEYRLLQLINQTSIISKLNAPDKRHEIDERIFKTFLFDNYYLKENNKNYILLFSSPQDRDNKYAKNYEKLIIAINNLMHTELFIRTLEENFIHQVSNYNIIRQSQVVVDENYIDYEKYMWNYQFMKWIFVPSNMNNIFTEYAGKEWDQFWFSFNGRSNIDFNDQDNLFFSKTKFQFTMDKDTNTLSKIIKPNINLYFIPEFIFFISMAITSCWVFIRKDLK